MSKDGNIKDAAEYTVEDAVVRVLREVYPHYKGSIVFKELPSEFEASAKMLLIDMEDGTPEREFKYLMSQREIKIVEVLALNKLNELIPPDFNHFIDKNENTIYIDDEDRAESEISVRLIKLPLIKRIINTLKEAEEKCHREYFFADFYKAKKLSVRQLELDYLKYEQGE